MSILLLLKIVILFCLHASCSSNPLLYAVDAGDGNGLILLQRLHSSCPYYYKSIDNTAKLLLRFYSGQWEITQGARYYNSQSSCGVASGSGTQLFTHEGKDIKNGSWVNVQNASNFSIYALEDCTMYEGAFIDADFGRENAIAMKSEDPSQCPNEAHNSGQYVIPAGSSFIIYTTTIGKEPSLLFRNGLNRRILWCKFNSNKIFTRAVLKLDETDEYARVIFAGRKCNAINTARSAKIVNINDALVSTNVDSAAYTDGLKESEKTSSTLPWLWIAIVAGAAVLTLTALGFISYSIFKCLQKKKGGMGHGNYGRASIDSNFQYGEDKEYYKYQYDKKQTRVVDNNDMYNYDYE